MSPMLFLSDKDRGRANNFDALRLVLATAVIFSHSYPLIRGNNDTEPVSLLTGNQKTLGEIAVEGFFLLSGYLITASWLRSRDCLVFFRKRILRIYPAFIVASLFTICIAAPLYFGNLGAYFSRIEWGRTLLNIPNLDCRHPDVGAPMNGALWSIRYEFLCYVAVAVIGLIGLFRWPGLLILASLFCTSLYAAQLHLGFQMPGSRLTWLWCYPGFWPRMAACFFAGSAFFLYRHRVPHSPTLALAATVVLALTMAVPEAKGFNLLFPLVGGYIFLYLSYCSTRPLEFITRHGDFSYGIYLYAFPIQQLLIKSFKGSLSPLVLSVLALVITSFFAFLSWNLIEMPFLSLKEGTSWTQRSTSEKSMTTAERVQPATAFD